MELKELTSKICDLFGCISIDTLPDKIMFALFSQNPFTYFDKYKELCPDLTVDWLQKVYQFYHADREDKKQDYTPVSLARLVACLSYTPDERVVYDCCAGSGALTIQKWCANPDLKFVCEELDERVIPILLFNLCIRNIEATVLHKNVLTEEVYKVYVVSKGCKYSSIQQMLYDSTDKPQTAISNPPFNLKFAVKANDTRFIDVVPPSSNANFAFILNAMSKADKAVFILPSGILTSKDESECRQKLLDKGWLKTIISMPERMFESTSISICIVVLDKRKTTKDVMIVDATDIKAVEIREQRGEDKAYNRVYRKEINTLTDVQIASILELSEKESKNVSMLVTYDRASEFDFKLIPGVYKIIERGDVLHRGYEEIIEDLNRVIRERNVIKLTVNKVWADRLNLTDIAKENDASVKVTEQINEALKQLDINAKIVPNRYIALSNSKVFCIENTDKEILSSLLSIFIPMFRQHIFYLNNEENRLLAELRDAMLPDLMNGKLTFND